MSGPEWLRVVYQSLALCESGLRQSFTLLLRTLDLCPVEFRLTPCGVLDLGPGCPKFGVSDHALVMDHFCT